MIIANKKIETITASPYTVEALCKIDANFDGSLLEFINLDVGEDNYPHKISVVKKLISPVQLISFSLLCANNVLPIFNERFPEQNKFNEAVKQLSDITDLSDLNEDQKAEIYKGTYHLITAERMARNKEAYAASYVPNCFLMISLMALGEPALNDVSTMAVLAAETVNKMNQREINLEFLREVL